MMTKRVLSLLLAFVMVFALLPVSAQAATAYENAVAAIDAKKPATQTQVYRYNDTFTTKKSGLCNVSAMVTLLNRRLAYDNRSGSFSVVNVLTANGCTNITNSGTKYAYSGDTGSWMSKTYSNGSYSYTAKSISSSTIKNSTTKEDFYKYIATLLWEHPEGLAMRNTKATHVAVIYKYEVVGTKIQLYVKDPVSNYSGKIENSYLYKHCDGKLYDYVNFIVYLKGSAPAAGEIPSNPPAPGAPSVSVSGQNVTVSWNNVANETGYDVYLVQSPWGWGDIKYSTHVGADTTSCVFTGVAFGDYSAFVIARPNADNVQSGWTSLSVVQPQYTITYDANGGTGAPPQQVFSSGGGYYFSTVVPTRAGYSFVNWRDDSTGQLFNPGDPIPASWGNHTLRAQWQLNAPVITGQPQNASVNAGSFAVFRITASGAGLSYQWQYRRSSTGTWMDSPAAGNTTATVSIEATAAKNGYQYRCRVSNSAGSVNSSAATLTVSSKPVITAQPSNVSAADGTTATFTVKATGATSYQWQFRRSSSGTWENSPATGNTTATLKVAAAAAKNGYQYRCCVTNAVGTVNSSAATLTVTGGKPVITTQPKNVTAAEGATATFTVKATGATKYQWQYRRSSTGTWMDSPAAGSTTATVSIEATAAKNGYQYRCRVTNANGTVNSSAATLTVSSKPVITAQPSNVSAADGATATFTVKATGATSYQWQFRRSSSGTWENSPATGNTTATLKVAAAAAKNGYQYRCRVTNAVGTVNSSAATLTVTGGKPVITTQPKNVTAADGTTATFTVKANGATKYQWQFRRSSSGTWENSPATGNTTATLKVAATAAKNGYQYRCRVTNAVGTVNSSAATLSVSTVQYRALVIGNGTPSSVTATGCINDMNAMAGMLRGLKNKFTVTARSDRTAAQIRSDIQTAFAGADDSDVSLFYYSGTALSSSTDSSKVGAILGVDHSYITTSELASLLSAVPGRVIVIMDSNHSAALISDGRAVTAGDLAAFNESVIDAFAARDAVIAGPSAERTAPDPEAAVYGSRAGELQGRKKFIVITSAAYSELSISSTINGYDCKYYSYYFITGTGSSYPNGAYSGSIPCSSDGSITVNEIFTYARSKTSAKLDSQCYAANMDEVIFRR